MHITCLQEHLKKAINITERIIGRNLMLPILNNLLLSIENNKLKISSTNLEIGINHWMPGKIEAKGTITVPARLFSDFVNNLPNQNVELKVKDNNLAIKCDKFRGTLKGLAADEFPIIPKIKDKPLIKIKGGLLKNGLAQVVGMVATSDSRPAISGVCMKIMKNSICLAATDSFRLAEKTIQLSSDDILDKGINNKEYLIILPQRTVQELIRILGEKESEENDDAIIILSNNQIFFDLKTTQLVSRLIEDQYPDYQQVIPKDFSTQVTINRSELINNVKVASLFSSKVNDIKIVCDAKKSVVEISAQDSDIGEQKSHLEAEIKGDEVSGAFNYKYVLDGLNNIYSDKVLIGFDKNGKAVISPIGDKSYTYVVMPIKA